ncbi:MAG: hypothetical protein Pg6A_20070 [Termitinemataceae bacterium]|nr:MAG: hypothetical protein Pg6A_20070 [Termitinemataceae bacterium]
MTLQSYASDVLEDAMTLAQTKALNSYSFRDCMNTLSEIWGYVYDKISQIDEGFYSQTIRLSSRVTPLPPCVRSTVRIYAALDPVGYNRKIYKESGYTDLNSYGTYHISGNDLYCPDAERIDSVWLNYTPEPPLLTFTKNNRDPRILKEPPPVLPMFPQNYHVWQLDFVDNRYVMKHRSGSGETQDVTDIIQPDTDNPYSVTFIRCDYPYVFVTYRDNVTEEYESVILKDIISSPTRRVYNPFDYMGRRSNVAFLDCRWNDYTGMGVTIMDYDDIRGGQPTIKELGWTPDTLMTYPSRIMYNYVVATLAKRFADINGATIMAVESAVVTARYQINNFLSKDKSSWKRIDNVIGPVWADYL